MGCLQPALTAVLVMSDLICNAPGKSLLPCLSYSLGLLQERLLASALVPFIIPILSFVQHVAHIHLYM